eukprot:10681882-Lingulodinium_polyedra.AAC.1
MGTTTPRTCACIIRLLAEIGYAEARGGNARKNTLRRHGGGPCTPQTQETPNARQIATFPTRWEGATRPKRTA